MRKFPVIQRNFLSLEEIFCDMKKFPAMTEPVFGSDGNFLTFQLLESQNSLKMKCALKA